MDLVNVKNGVIVANSVMIAELFEKTHKHVLEKVRNMDCSEEFRGSSFRLSSYKSEQGKVLKCIDFTRDGFAFVCMSFTGPKAAAFKEKYIRAFNAMESELLSQSNLLGKLNEIDNKIELDAVDGSKLGVLLQQRKLINKTNDENRKKILKNLQPDLFDIG